MSFASPPCPVCGFILIEDETAHTVCPGCGSERVTGRPSELLLAEVLGQAPVEDVFPRPAASRVSNHGYLRGAAGGAAVTALAGALLFATGVWPPIPSPGVSAREVRQELQELRERAEMAETAAAELTSAREIAVARVKAAEQARTDLESRLRAAEAVHAESLEILRATQSERDELQATVAELEEEVAASLAAGGTSFVRRWQVIGPLSQKVAPGIADAVERDPFDAELRIEGLKGEVGWRIHAGADDRVSLSEFFDCHTQAACYLVSWVYSDGERKVTLSTGSDDGFCLWLNDEKTAERRGARSSSPGQEKTQALLRDGWNELLVQVDNEGGGEWAWYLEFRSEDGSKPLPLASTPKPPRNRRR